MSFTVAQKRRWVSLAVTSQYETASSEVANLLTVSNSCSVLNYLGGSSVHQEPELHTLRHSPTDSREHAKTR